MSLVPRLLRSLTLTAILTFLAPLLVLGALLLPLMLLERLNGLESLSRHGITQIFYFLQTFGSGNPLHGALIISLVCSLVGMLFDSYTLYRHEKFKNG